MENTKVMLFGQEIDLNRPLWEIEFKILDIFERNKTNMRKFLDSLNMFVIIDEDERIKRKIMYSIIEDLIKRIY